MGCQSRASAAIAERKSQVAVPGNVRNAPHAPPSRLRGTRNPARLRGEGVAVESDPWWPGRWELRHGSIERGVAEAEDPAVGGDLPVAGTVDRGSAMPYDRRVQAGARPSTRRTAHRRRRTSRRRWRPPSSRRGGIGGHAHDRRVERLPTLRAVEDGVTESEEAAVSADLEVARPSRVDAMPTTGALSFCPPIEPKNLASPKANTPPSLATSQ